MADKLLTLLGSSQIEGESVLHLALPSGERFDAVVGRADLARVHAELGTKSWSALSFEQAQQLEAALGRLLVWQVSRPKLLAALGWDDSMWCWIRRHVEGNTFLAEYVTGGQPESMLAVEEDGIYLRHVKAAPPPVEAMSAEQAARLEAVLIRLTRGQEGHNLPRGLILGELGWEDSMWGAVQRHAELEGRHLAWLVSEGWDVPPTIEVTDDWLHLRAS